MFESQLSLWSSPKKPRQTYALIYLLLSGLYSNNPEILKYLNFKAT